MKVHFLNVGHGECTIVEHDSGRITMIDINNGDDIDEKSASEIATETPSNYDELRLSIAGILGIKRKSILESAGYDIQQTNPVEYFRQKFGKYRAIDRYVQTHPDLDHMRGLNALHREGIAIRSIWDTSHSKVPQFKSDEDRLDWARYKKLGAGEWLRPGDTQVIRYNRGSQPINAAALRSGQDQDDGIYVLAPTPQTNQAANASGNFNNLSYVLCILAHGHCIILGGDAEEDVWKSIHATYGDSIKCNVLKASHHGRDSGYYQPAVAAMKPEYTIVSVGKKPPTDASNKYRTYSKNVWSTRWKGNIVLEIPSYGQATINPEYDR